MKTIILKCREFWHSTHLSLTEKKVAIYVSSWLVIFILGVVVFCHIYGTYPQNPPCSNLHNPMELFVRSCASSFDLFLFNIDSNGVDGWLEYESESSVWGWLLAVAALLAGVWTISIFALLLGSLYRRWRKKHAALQKTQTSLYIFVGINNRSKGLAKDIMSKNESKDVCLFIVPPTVEQDMEISMRDRITNLLQHKYHMYNNLGEINAQVLITEKMIAECAASNFWTDLGTPRIEAYVANSSEIHVLLLGEDESKNINDALILSNSALWGEHFDHLTIHCHARRSNANRVIEDIQESNTIKVIDSSHLAIELLKQDVENHPVKFVNLSTQYPGTVDSPFRCLIIGFSECGQDALRFLYEYSAFVGGENKNDLEKDIRSPFYCDIVDKQLDASAARWMHHSDEMFHSKNPDGTERISWHPIDYSSPDFYQNVLDPHIRELNYVVIAVGNDQAGITLAADILRYAIKCGRVDYNNPGNKFRIYVRSYDPDKYAFIKEVEKYYNREGQENEETFIKIFGGENEIYTTGMLIDDELKNRAKKYEENYNKVRKNVEEEIKKSEEIETAKASNPESQPKEEKKTANPYYEPDSPLKSKLDKRRKDSQNFANALHFQTKEEIKRFYDQEGIQLPLVRLAQTEHLRWWAAHEIMGYRSDGCNNEEKLILRYVHNCMKPWHDLDGARKYDFLTFGALYKPEEIAQAINNSKKPK